MSVVSNASALINTFASLSASLARIGELDLWRELYGELVIPEVVWQEVVVYRR
jgi:predicted nucleic acid-binding protein